MLAKFTAALLIFAKAQASGEVLYPGDMCCNFYKDNNYEGESLQLCYDLDYYGKNGQETFIINNG